jgi:hypothetical protein
MASGQLSYFFYLRGRAASWFSLGVHTPVYNYRSVDRTRNTPSMIPDRFDSDRNPMEQYEMVSGQLSYFFNLRGKVASRFS